MNSLNLERSAPMYVQYVKYTAEILYMERTYLFCTT